MGKVWSNWTGKIVFSNLGDDCIPRWCVVVSSQQLPSLKLTFSPLKIDGWNTIFLLGWPIFRGYVSFREGILFSQPPAFWPCEGKAEVIKETKMESQGDEGHRFWMMLEDNIVWMLENGCVCWIC